MDKDLYAIMKEIEGRENQNADEYKKFKVQGVEYIGTVELEEEINGVKTKIVKDVFKVTEEMEDGSIVENYYDENKEFIAGRDKNGRMYFNERGLYRDTNIMKQIEDLREQPGITLNQIEERVEEIAKHLGIEKEQVLAMSEIDLDQQIKEENKDSHDDKEEKEDEDKEISEETMKKAGITGLNEVDLNAQVDTKGTKLKDELNMRGYSKLIIVHSYELSKAIDAKGEKGEKNRLQLGIIAQKTDGTYEIPESLKVYRGNNNEVVEINSKDNAEIVREENIYEIAGKNKKMIISQRPSKENPYARPQIYLAKNTRDNDGNVAQFNVNNGKNKADKMRDEAKEHEANEDKEELTVEDVDGERDEMAGAVERIKEEYPDVERAFTDDEIRERIENLQKRNPEKDIENVAEIAGEDLANDAQYIHTRDSI